MDFLLLWRTYATPIAVDLGGTARSPAGHRASQQLGNRLPTFGQQVRTDSAGDQLTTPAKAASLLRSRAYLRLLVIAAILGGPISAAAYGYLVGVTKLQDWLYKDLPHEVGFSSVPFWWPFPLLVIGGIVCAFAIQYLPGTGGHEPADGFKAGGAPEPNQILGVALAALATLSFGAVLGPEAPLIALGGGLGAWAVSMARRGDVDQAKVMVAAAGSFAAISTLIDSPLVGAFLLMEATGLGGATIQLVLVPGLLAAGVGALIFTGLGDWTGLGTFSLSLPGLPHFARPDIAEIGWGLLIGPAAALLAIGIKRLALLIRPYVQPRRLFLTPVVGLVVAGIAVGFSQATGKAVSNVLFSGQSEVGPFLSSQANFTLGAVLLLFICKAVAYSVSLSSFRGGPIFPSIFIGAAGGVALSHLPGLPLVPAVAMGIGAMVVGMLRLPLTAVLLAVLLLSSDSFAVTPLVIISVVTAYVTVLHLDPPPKDQAPEAGTPSKTPEDSAGPGSAAPTT